MRDDDDDTLPWLEPAESEDDEDEAGFPYRGLIIACATVVGVIALLWMLADRFGGDDADVAAINEVPLIQAPEGPYKERPENPGGLDVDTDSLTHSVAEGEDTSGQLAAESLLEEPVPVTAEPPARARVVAPTPQIAPTAVPAAQEAVKRTPTPQPKIAVPAAVQAKAPAPTPTVAKVEPPKPAAPKPAPPVPSATSTTTVQLGAFNSAASADQVWSKLSARGAVSGLSKSVQPVEVGGKTLYRLRASGTADSASVCAKVQAAGEQCAVVR